MIKISQSGSQNNQLGIISWLHLLTVFMVICLYDSVWEICGCNLAFFGYDKLLQVWCIYIYCPSFIFYGLYYTVRRFDRVTEFWRVSVRSWSYIPVNWYCLVPNIIRGFQKMLLSKQWFQTSPCKTQILYGVLVRVSNFSEETAWP